MLSFRDDHTEHPHPMGHVHQFIHVQKCAVGMMSAAELNTGRELGESVLSVVIPAHNEAESLVQLIGETTQALRPLCHCADGLDDFEIIVIDDGSTDSTQSVLANLSSVHAELRWLILAKQVGQTAATIAGIRAARGDWIATLDADLQNDPADLVRLWSALPGHDAVLGWRVKRMDCWSRRVISFWANWLRNLVLGQSARDTGCSVRIFPRSVAMRMPTFHGMHRFLGPLLRRDGCRLVEVPVHHRPRAHGRSHYTLLNRSLQVLIDLLGVVWLMQRTVRFQILVTWDSTAKMNRGTPTLTQSTGATQFFVR
jgi:dolichol-phosphate mannosyltransferase